MTDGVVPGVRVAVTDPVPGGHPEGRSGVVVEVRGGLVLVVGDDGSRWVAERGELSVAS